MFCSVLSFASVAIVLRLSIMFVHTSHWGPRQVRQRVASPYRVGQVLVIPTRPAAVSGSDGCWLRGQLGHRHLYSSLSRTYCRNRVQKRQRERGNRRKERKRETETERERQRERDRENE